MTRGVASTLGERLPHRSSYHASCCLAQQRSRAWMALMASDAAGRLRRPCGECYERGAANVNGGSDQPFEQLHVDRLAGSDVARVGGKYDKTVRLRHRREDARALVAGRAHGPSSVAVGGEDAALEFGASRDLPDRRREGHLERR